MPKRQKQQLFELLDHARDLSNGSMQVIFTCQDAAEYQAATEYLKRKKHAKMVILRKPLDDENQQILDELA